MSQQDTHLLLYNLLLSHLHKHFCMHTHTYTEIHMHTQTLIVCCWFQVVCRQGSRLYVYCSPNVSSTGVLFQYKQLSDGGVWSHLIAALTHTVSVSTGSPTRQCNSSWRRWAMAQITPNWSSTTCRREYTC